MQNSDNTLYSSLYFKKWGQRGLTLRPISLGFISSADTLFFTSQRQLKLFVKRFCNLSSLFFSLHPSPNAITPRRFLWRLLSGNTWTSLPFYKSRLLGWSRGFRFVQTLPAGSVSVSETPCQAEIAGCEYCGEASLSIFYNLCVRPICIVSKLRADWLRRVTELRWALSERIWKCGSVVLPRTCITIK